MKNGKNLCRRIFCGISALVICMAFLGGCEEAEEKFPEPTAKFFANDFAECMTESDENDICSRGAALQEKTGAQVVAVTVNTTDGEEISDYALELGRKWGIGEKDKNNGVLILLASSDREIYIAVGYGLEGALPDSKTGRILDVYAIPHLKADDFSTGIAEAYKAIVNEIYLENGIETDENYIPINEVKENDQPSGWIVLISWIVLIVIAVIFAIIARKRGIHVFWFPPGGFGGMGGGGIGGMGGGRFGGGGFSGGGGSFGGGGAGRGF